MQLDNMKITNYYWPKSNNVKVQGNIFNPNYAYFLATIEKWVGTDSKGNPCKSDIEIEKAISKSSLSAAFVNAYFDSNDFDKPVKEFVDDRLFEYLVNGYTKEIAVYIKKDLIELQDSVFRYSPNGDKKEFYCNKHNEVTFN